MSAKSDRPKDLRLALEKLSDFAAALLDGFLIVTRSYAVLEPMITDRDVFERWGTNLRGPGFGTIREVLYMNCVHEVAKLAGDRDDRTASVSTVMRLLMESGIRAALREDFSTCVVSLPLVEPGNAGTTVHQEQLANMQSVIERLEREFDQIWERTWATWGRVQGQDWFPRFIRIRNAVTAHREVRKRKGESFQALKAEDFGLDWRDASTALDALEPLMMDLNVLVRNEDFGIAGFRAEAKRVAVDFWAPWQGGEDS